MSKYTAEQVRNLANRLKRNAQDKYGALHGTQCESAATMLHDYAALLCERESVKVVATDVWPEYVMLRDTGLHDDAGGLGQRIYTTAGSGYKKRKYFLEAATPMLASARVPDELESAPASPLHPLWGDGYLRGWNACRKAVLAAASQPETEE